MLSAHSDLSVVAEELVRCFGVSRSVAERDVALVWNSLFDVAAVRVTPARRPTWRGVGLVARQWRRTGPQYRLAILKVAVALVIVECGLRLTNLRFVARSCGVPLAADSVDLSRAFDGFQRLSATEQRDFFAVEWVLGRWIFDPTCLRRALVLGWLLRHRRPRLRLGLVEGELIAHAWLQIEDFVLHARSVDGLFSARLHEVAG